MTIEAEAKRLIEEALPGATVHVSGGGGHYEISVVAAQFAGQRTLARQRLVYGAITPLMAGDAAPLHAVDRLTCKAPDEA